MDGEKKVCAMCYSIGTMNGDSSAITTEFRLKNRFTLWLKICLPCHTRLAKPLRSFFVDYFTKWPDAFPTADHTADTIAQL